MKTNPRMRRGFTLVELLVVISIIATLAGVGVPVIINQQKKGARSEAIANIKQVGMALFSFEQDYDSYPCLATVQTLEDAGLGAASGFTLGSPTKSNDYLRQLLAGNFIDTEKSFYAKSSYTKKPDNVFKTAGTALVAGECGFAYIMADSAGVALASSGNSGRPLLAAAVLSNNTEGKFELDVYDRKAVVFRIDNSATAESVVPTGTNMNKVLLPVSSGGAAKTLLDPGDQSVWGKNAAGTSDLTPVLVPPLPK
jgi:prepilin-type N-terminal cleavage/methylation domain-containing protein